MYDLNSDIFINLGFMCICHHLSEYLIFSLYIAIRQALAKKNDYNYYGTQCHAVQHVGKNKKHWKSAY